MAAIPPEISWLVPVILPFIIGLLVGAIIRRVARLVFLVIGLVVILAGTGYISMSFQDIYDQAMKFLPKIYDAGGDVGGGFKESLPYTSTAFLVGLAIGLWKG